MEQFIENLDIDMLKHKLLTDEDLKDEDAIDELLLTNPQAAIEQGNLAQVARRKKKGNIMNMALPYVPGDNDSDPGTTPYYPVEPIEQLSRRKSTIPERTSLDYD